MHSSKESAHFEAYGWHIMNNDSGERTAIALLPKRKFVIFLLGVLIFINFSIVLTVLLFPNELPGFYRVHHYPPGQEVWALSGQVVTTI